MAKLRPYCLTIAGFDPSGGAGVIADCKTFERCKTLGLAVITANTMQTEDEFFTTYWTEKEWVLKQLDILMSRYSLSFFKIGLIESAEILEEVLKCIAKRRPGSTVIWDPVLSASAGGEWNEDRFAGLKIPDGLGDFWLTPNQHEKQMVAFVPPKSFVYEKGGHSTELGKDFLFHDGKTYPFNSKIKTKSTKHGTGCVFSSALLAQLARGRKPIRACLEAKRYVERLIVSNNSLLGYH